MFQSDIQKVQQHSNRLNTFIILFIDFIKRKRKEKCCGLHRRGVKIFPTVSFINIKYKGENYQVCFLRKEHNSLLY